MENEEVLFWQSVRYPKVKIIATIGPATNNESSVRELINAGVNIFRLNFSYGTYDEHKQTIELIRKLSRDRPIAIMQDICGPKIRITNLPKPVTVEQNSSFKIYRDEVNGLSISHSEILNSLDVGDLIYVADGRVKLKITSIGDLYIEAKSLTSGVIKNGSGVNIPKGNLNIPAITQKDERDLEFGAKMGVDFVAVSFVESAEDIKKAKSILIKNGSDAWVVAKIERKAAVDNFKEIANESDCVMVARGDLGAEIGLSRVPIIKRRIIAFANEHCKPVIVATQMLTSMINSSTPTRAEVSDIANAVLTGADCVMLSDETAIGKFYKEAVDILRDTIIEAQSIYSYYIDYSADKNEIIAKCAVEVSKKTDTSCIVSATETAYTVKQIAKFKPQKPIIAVTFNEGVKRRLAIVWGVADSIVLKRSDNAEDFIKSLDGTDIPKPFVLTMGSIIGKQGSTNMVRVFY